MGLILDTPLIRQESHASCWFAAGRMLKAYAISDEMIRKIYVERSQQLQRGITPGNLNRLLYSAEHSPRISLFHQVSRSTYAREYVPITHQDPLDSHQRPSSTPSYLKLNFYGKELKKYLETEHLKKLERPELIELLANEHSSASPSDLERIMSEIENSLREYGPIMCSIYSFDSKKSHAIVIIGIFQTEETQTYPSRYVPKGKYGLPTRSPQSNYWVVINDPGASICPVDSTNFNATKTDCKPHSAESYYLPLSAFIQLIHTDMQKHAEKSHEKISHPVLIINPKNHGIVHELPLPKEAINPQHDRLSSKALKP